MDEAATSAAATAAAAYAGLDHSNRQDTFIGIIAAFTALATVTVLLRLYTRAMIVKGFGLGKFFRFVVMIGEEFFFFLTGGQTITLLL
jgi:hypothetical protein